MHRNRPAAQLATEDAHDVREIECHADVPFDGRGDLLRDHFKGSLPTLSVVLRVEHRKRARGVGQADEPVEPHEPVRALPLGVRRHTLSLRLAHRNSVGRIRDMKLAQDLMGGFDGPALEGPDEAALSMIESLGPPDCAAHRLPHLG